MYEQLHSSAADALNRHASAAAFPLPHVERNAGGRKSLAA